MSSGEAPRAAIGPYRIERELGRGGMGVVYLARDPALGRPVALKVLRRSSPAARQRLLTEARASAAIRHPNVVRVHDVRELEGHLVLVMDYVEGVNLDERLQREGSVPAAEAARLTTDLARALAAGHGRRILHRDVKPDNVLIRAHDGAALLTDFGLAKFQDEGKGLTQSGAILGTPLYASPEQLAGGALDARSDVYGLGALLYAMLTGQPPLTGETLVQLVARVCEERPAPPSQLRADVPPWLDDVCLQCLEKDPARRYPSAGALAQALQAGESHGSGSGTSRAASKDARRLGVALTAAALALAALGVTLWASTRGDGDAAQHALYGPLPPGPLELDLPRTARPPSPELRAHVAARTALLRGDPVPPGEAPDLRALAALGALRWGRPRDAGPDAELWTRHAAYAQALETLAALEQGPDAEPATRWAGDVARRARGELQEVRARAAKRVDTHARGGSPAPIPAGPWAAFERDASQVALRARGLELLEALRAELPPGEPLLAETADAARALIESYFPATRATSGPERDAFVDWLSLATPPEGAAEQSFDTLWHTLPDVLHAVGPRIRFADVPPDLMLRARGSVELIYSGYLMTLESPSHEEMLLGALVGLWPISRVRRLRPDLPDELQALPILTGEQLVTLYVALEHEASVSGERLLGFLVDALGDDVPARWREALDLPPAGPVAQPVSPGWIPHLRVRLLEEWLAVERVRERPLSAEHLAFCLEELPDAISANQRSGVEPRLQFMIAPKVLGDLAEAALAAKLPRAKEAQALAESTCTRIQAELLAFLRNETVLESQIPGLREGLSKLTLDLARLHLDRADPRSARALLERTLDAWKLWDPNYPLLSYRCWIAVVARDPDALARCREQREWLLTRPQASALRPAAYREELARAKAIVLSSELVALVQSGAAEEARALAARELDTYAGVKLPELQEARIRVRRGR
ncbi:MAG: protein kinase [Planctomycetota bacterium]